MEHLTKYMKMWLRWISSEQKSKVSTLPPCVIIPTVLQSSARIQESLTIEFSSLYIRITYSLDNGAILQNNDLLSEVNGHHYNFISC